MIWASLMTAATVPTPHGIGWPTPEQIRAVLVPVQETWSPTSAEWVAGGVAVAVFLSCLVWGGALLESDNAHQDWGFLPLGLGIAGLLCTLLVMWTGGWEQTNTAEYMRGQERAAALLAGPLDHEHPGWIVAIGDSDSKDGVRAFLPDSGWSLIDDSPRVEFVAYDPAAGRHECVLRPLVTSTHTRDGIGPDGPTSVGTSEVTGGLSCGEADQ